MSRGPLEITWMKDGQILYRENAHDATFDAAVVGAWLDLPRIARMTGGDPDRIEFHDSATGHTLVEDVPQQTQVSGFAVMAPYLLIGMTVLIVILWLSSHGYSGEAGTVLSHALNLLPEFAVGAIAAFLWAHSHNRNARRRWTGTPERGA